MRLQTLLTRRSAPHHPAHALRGLDLRRRDADAGGSGAHPRARGADRVAGGEREQVERAVG